MKPLFVSLLGLVLLTFIACGTSATATPSRTPTLEPTQEPTATSMPEPTATSTPQPTATPTVEPTATSTPEPTQPPTPTDEPVSVNAAEHPDLGTILTDASGRTLYLFANDAPDTSNCSGGCALAWPPLLTMEDPTAGEGVNAAKLGIITRADGSRQVTYDGKPLYYYAQDAAPGDVRGQDVGGVWFVVHPDDEGGAGSMMDGEGDSGSMPGY